MVCNALYSIIVIFFFQAEDGIRDHCVTGVQTCALPICRQEAEKNWAAFQADPEWKKVKAESEANGPLVDHIDHYFMDPTSFSRSEERRVGKECRSRWLR